jgi:hypothetical protein
VTRARAASGSRTGARRPRPRAARGLAQPALLLLLPPLLLLLAARPAAALSSVSVAGRGDVLQTVVPRNLWSAQSLTLSNGTAVLLRDSEAAELLCGAVSGSASALSSLRSAVHGADLVVVEHSRTFFARISQCILLFEYEYMELLCSTLGPRVVLAFESDASVGSYGNFNPNGVRSECAVFEARKTLLFAALGDACAGCVSVSSEANPFTEFFRRAPTWLLLRVAPTLSFAALALFGASVTQERWEGRHSDGVKTHPIMWAVLGLNTWWSAVFCVWSARDGWGTAQQPVSLQLENLFRTGLFGQGAALDCLLAALWYELNAGNDEQAVARVRRARILLVMLALVTAAYDLCIDIAYAALRMPTSTMVMLPQSLAVVALLMSCIISRQSFLLYRKTEAISRLVESDKIHQLQRRLLRAGILGAVSGFGSVIALVMAAIMFESPTHFVAVNFLGITCRVLNIASQLWYCSLGRSKLREKLYPFLTKISARSGHSSVSDLPDEDAHDLFARTRDPA